MFGDDQFRSEVKATGRREGLHAGFPILFAFVEVQRVSSIDSVFEDSAAGFGGEYSTGIAEGEFDGELVAVPGFDLGGRVLWPCKGPEC